MVWKPRRQPKRGEACTDRHRTVRQCSHCALCALSWPRSSQPLPRGRRAETKNQVSKWLKTLRAGPWLAHVPLHPLPDFQPPCRRGLASTLGAPPPSAAVRSRRDRVVQQSPPRQGPPVNRYFLPSTARPGRPVETQADAGDPERLARSGRVTWPDPHKGQPWRPSRRRLIDNTPRGVPVGLQVRKAYRHFLPFGRRVRHGTSQRQRCGSAHSSAHGSASPRPLRRRNRHVSDLAADPGPPRHSHDRRQCRVARWRGGPLGAPPWPRRPPADRRGPSPPGRRPCGSISALSAVQSFAGVILHAPASCLADDEFGEGDGRRRPRQGGRHPGGTMGAPWG